MKQSEITRVLVQSTSLCGSSEKLLFVTQRAAEQHLYSEPFLLFSSIHTLSCDSKVQHYKVCRNDKPQERPPLDGTFSSDVIPQALVTSSSALRSIWEITVLHIKKLPDYTSGVICGIFLYYNEKQSYF